jgi:superfamily II DNA or RNA helicase
MNKKEYKDINIIPSISNISLQKYQKFIRNFINTNTNNNELFLYFKTGSGKTLSSLLVSEMFRKNTMEIDGKIIIVGSFVSRQEFINTLTSKFINIANNIPTNEDNIFISDKEKKELEDLYNDINIKTKQEKNEIKKKNKKYIEKRLEEVGYIFMSYQKFMNNKLGNINNSLLIIDESHNLLNNNKYNQALKLLIEESVRYKILLLSATPMFNKAKDIVDHSNMMFKKKDLIEYKKIFDNEENIKEGGMHYLQEKLKGKISYIKGSGFHNFPKKIEIGTILNRKSIAKTKVIKVKMSELQYSTYIKKYNGNITYEIRDISNAVFPSPYNKSIGIFKNINKEYKYFDKKWNEKNGIKIIIKNGEPRFRGSILKYNNLLKYSPKYARCLKDINEKTVSGKDKGKCFVYNSFVNNTGIKLFGSILSENGYKEYSDLNDRSGKQFILYYQDTSIEDRLRLLKIFNSKENLYGDIIKILVGSTLTKEGLDLKAVKHLFIINYQENFSRIDQIKGRGIRFKSHHDLPVDERFTKIYIYVSSLPDGVNDESFEEIEYKKNEKDMIKIKKIERVLKVAAVDCSFNKEFNTFKEGIDGSEECGFDKCEYKCKYPFINEKDDDFDLTYKLFYKDEEIYEAKEYIKYLFRDNIILNLNTILDNVTINGGILREFVYIALNYLVENKKIFNRNKFSKGYIINIDSNYLFQPFNITDLSINLNERINNIISVKEKTNINKFIEELLIEESNKYVFNIDEIISKLKNKNYVELSFTLSKLNLRSKIKILERSIRKYIKKKISELDFNILKYFKSYLIDENQIINSLNNINTDIYFDSLSMNKIDKNKKFIGHFLDQIAKIYNKKTDKFIDITSDFFKRKSKIKYRDNDYIIGFIDKDKNGDIQFKLKYSSKNNSLLIDKRKFKRGFVCRYTNNKKELLNIAIKLGIKKIEKLTEIQKNKIKILDLCKLLEKDLREKQLYSDEKKLGVRWFNDYII